MDIPSIKIYGQIWSKKNLDVNTFRNGDPIKEARSDEEWKHCIENKIPACCYYENSVAKGDVHGRIYNWYALIDPRGLAPEGWRVANREDWEALTMLYGGEEIAAIKLKSIVGWARKGNGILNNDKGIACLPGGHRYSNGTFSGIDFKGIWWVYPIVNDTSEIFQIGRLELSFDSDSAGFRGIDELEGAYIRLLKEEQ